MSEDTLTHNLVVRISEATRDELAVAAARENITVAEYVRRSIALDMAVAYGRSLDPYAALPTGYVEGHLIEAVDALRDPGARQDLTLKFGEECAEAMGALDQTLCAIFEEADPNRVERARGYLRQASLSLLKAASRAQGLSIVAQHTCSNEQPAPLLLGQEVR